MPSPPWPERGRSVPRYIGDRLWKSSASPYQNRPLGGKAIPHVSIAGAEYAQMMPQGCVGMEVLMNGGLRRYGLRRAGFLLSACLGVFLTAAPALSQPSQSQINAVRQNCRSDYMAHCSSVPPGGAESLNACRTIRRACRPAAAAPSTRSSRQPRPQPQSLRRQHRLPRRRLLPRRNAPPHRCALRLRQRPPRPKSSPVRRLRNHLPAGRHRRRGRLRLPPQHRPNLHGCTCRCRRCCRASNSESSVRAMATGRRSAAWCRSAADA